MKKSKFLALMIALLLVMAAFAACGQAEPEEPATGGGQQEEEAGEPAEGGDIDSAYLMDVLSQGKAAVEGMRYDMTIRGGGQTMTMQCYLEGDKVKMISSIQGIETVTIIDGDTMVNYDPASKTGMRFANEGGAADAEGYVDSDISDDFDQTSMTYLGKEEFDGEECLTVMAKGMADSGEVKLWINERLGIVVKMEAATTDGQVMTTELTNVEIGKQPAGTFDVPADVEIVELPGM